MKKEALLFIGLLIASIFPLVPVIYGDTLDTIVTVSNVYPYIMRSDMYVFKDVGDSDDDQIDLVENSTVQVTCNATIYDPNGNTDISSVSGTLYDTTNSNHAAGDDNNIHYTNGTCTLFSGSGTSRGGECQFTVEYYANNATWSCNMSATDSGSNENSTYSNTTLNQLIALMVPAEMYFGSLNPGEEATNRTNLTNTGNVRIGIKIYGYGNNKTDSPNAMNCTAGTDMNISLYFMKFNVTDVATAGACALVNWTTSSVNLTNESNERAWNKSHNYYLYQRQNDNMESKNTTCWALRIPTGAQSDVSGTCKGVISFTACQFDSCSDVLGGGDY